jgi:hypothetical protein
MTRIAPDKWRHFFVGIIMGVLLQAFLSWLLRDHFILAIAGTFIIVAAVSYGFELYSKITGRGTYEVMDAVAAVIGGILGMAAVLAVRHFF